VGLGDGIVDGLREGILVVGNSVGLAVGKVDGIALGPGVGAIEGLGDGINVDGNLVGVTVGDGVGAHVSQYKSIHFSTGTPLPDVYTSHKLGPPAWIPSSAPYTAKIPDSVSITHDPLSLIKISLPS